MHCMSDSSPAQRQRESNRYNVLSEIVGAIKMNHFTMLIAMHAVYKVYIVV